MSELLKRSEEASMRAHTWTWEDHKLVILESKTTEAYEEELLQEIAALEKRVEAMDELAERVIRFYEELAKKYQALRGEEESDQGGN